MGRGIIDVPLQVTAEFLKDIENYMSWDNSLVVSAAFAYSPQTLNLCMYLLFFFLGIQKCEIPFACIS